MKTRILGTGKTGSMKNEIVLNVFDSFAIRDLVKAAIEKDNGEKYKSYDKKHWEEFLRMFDLAYTAPSMMEERNLEDF